MAVSLAWFVIRYVLCATQLGTMANEPAIRCMATTRGDGLHTPSSVCVEYSDCQFTVPTSTSFDGGSSNYV